MARKVRAKTSGHRNASARGLGFEPAEWRPGPEAREDRCDSCGRAARVREVAINLIVNHDTYQKAIIWSGQCCGMCFGSLNKMLTESGPGRGLRRGAVAVAADGRVQELKKG
jgi:hypothetical protein